MLFVSLWGGGGGVQELKPLEGLIGLRRVWDSRFRIVGILGLDWGTPIIGPMLASSVAYYRHMYSSS